MDNGDRPSKPFTQGDDESSDTEEEIAKRRDEGLRRLLRMKPKPQKHVKAERGQPPKKPANEK